MDYTLNDRATLVGEFGVLPHAPFDKASTIAAPLAIPGSDSPRVNAYHWNGNLKVRPFEFGRLEPLCHRRVRLVHDVGEDRQPA